MAGAKSIELLTVQPLLVLQGVLHLTDVGLSSLLRLLRLFSLVLGLLCRLPCLPRRLLQGCQGAAGFLSFPESLRGGSRRPFSNVPGLCKLSGLDCATKVQGLRESVFSSIR
jgi:hypothetical protein